MRPDGGQASERLRVGDPDAVGAVVDVPVLFEGDLGDERG